MSKALKYSNGFLANPLLWLVFALYLFLSAYAIAHHEMWGDEIHSWNIAKGSFGFFDLMHNVRYEGHPPVWYVIIWTISRFTHNVVFVQAVHWFIAVISVFLILFFSPIPLVSRSLLPFGYYFLFEYTVLSRNYAIAVLLTICICIILQKNFRYKMLLYYLLLYLLANTHLLGILMAASLHVYFLFLYKKQNKRRRLLNIHAFIGPLIIMTGVYFIFPPSDSEMNVQFWLNRWGSRNFISLSQAPLRSFIPISAWWKYNFWNSQFMIEASKGNTLLFFIGACLSAFVIIVLVFILRKNKESQVLFYSHLFFSFIVAMTFFTFGSARYAGFLYISFIASYWLYCSKTLPGKKSRFIVNTFFIVQVAGSIVPIARDIQYPFSNAYRINELLAKVPANEKTVTDYWALNAIAAFADKPFYCIDLQKEVYFLKWDSKLKAGIFNPSRYTDGVTNFLQQKGVTRLYLLSTVSPSVLSRIDEKLSKTFDVTIVDQTQGAIEADSDLYLYEISKAGSPVFR